MELSELFFIPTVVFLVIVAPLWLVLHYRSRHRARAFLDAQDRRDLEALLVDAEEMGRRIDTLEAILDAEAPGWRERSGP